MVGGWGEHIYPKRQLLPETISLKVGLGGVFFNVCFDFSPEATKKNKKEVCKNSTLK